MSSVKEALVQNLFLQKELQRKYDAQKSYYAKFDFIYNTLITSQGEYLKSKKDKVFMPKYLNSLQKDLAKIKNLDDNKFIEFVIDNVIKLLPSPHVSIKPVEEIKQNNNQEELQKKPLEKTNEIQNISYFKNSEMPGTMTINFKSFSKNYLENDKKIFNEIEKFLESQNIKNVIFDLRGNGGGTDEYFRFFSIFTNKTISLKEKYRHLFFRKNFEYETKYIEGNPQNTELNKFLLVDKNVFSSAETFTTLCKQSGFATVIGEKTKGEGFGLTPLSLQISNFNYTGKYNKSGSIIKGIKITIPTEAPVNAKGKIDYENFYNTAPDIVCEGSQAMQIALKQIEKLAEQNLSQQM